MTSTGYAPGKIILLGEHSVVFGQPALAAALPFGLTVRATKTNEGGLVLDEGLPRDARVLEALGVIGRAVGVEHAFISASSDLPPGGGLGSSAAFAVALTRALSGLNGASMTDDDVGNVALASEQIFHGRPSGLDHTTCTRAQLIRFWKGPPPRVETLRAAKPLSIVVALTGESRQASANVMSLVARAAQQPERYDPLIGRLGELALAGSKDVETGDLVALGLRMNEAHALLSECGVSCGSLDAAVSAAQKAGALGAKLTGAGGGGAAIALAPDPAPVVHAIRALGMDVREALIA